MNKNELKNAQKWDYIYYATIMYRSYLFTRCRHSFECMCTWTFCHHLSSTTSSAAYANSYFKDLPVSWNRLRVTMPRQTPQSTAISVSSIASHAIAMAVSIADIRPHNISAIAQSILWPRNRIQMKHLRNEWRGNFIPNSRFCVRQIVHTCMIR